MEWKQAQQPYTGLHWWYRILTGTSWTYPYMAQKGHKIYWKSKIGEKKKTPCTLLNWLAWVEFRVRDIKRCLVEFCKTA